ncbi:K(+) efflux antiporter 2, chloroplastic [Andrographis paniculata]|uniref:K(+) efflux antiporter 2, chloroplastic n=1 Tax=Andrographis paniculata TaxID=175694 RepID=UPI0021E8809F|nr:K(+) efflux antiporter 2, chloroplastic [Andrographis paniculata]
MDVASSLSQSNIFHVEEVTGYKALKQLALKPKLKYSHDHGKFLGDLKHLPNTYSMRKLRISQTACCFGSVVPIVFDVDNSWLWPYGFYGSLCDGYILKMSKNISLSQHQMNRTVAHAMEGCSDEEVIEPVEDVTGHESIASEEVCSGKRTEAPGLDELKEALKQAAKDLKDAHISRKLYEEKIQSITQSAIVLLKDIAANARNDVNRALLRGQKILREEVIAKEGVQDATMSLFLATARLKEAIDSVKTAKEKKQFAKDAKGNEFTHGNGKENANEFEVAFAALMEIKLCQIELENREVDLRRIQSMKEELQKEVQMLDAAAKKAELELCETEKALATIMLVTERLQSANHVEDAEIALQPAQKDLTDAPDSAEEDAIYIQMSAGNSLDTAVEKDRKVLHEAANLRVSDEHYKDKAQLNIDQLEIESEAEVLKTFQSMEKEMQKESPRKSSPFSARRFPKKQWPKLFFWSLLVGAGTAIYVNQTATLGPLHQQAQIIITKPRASLIRKLPMKMKRLIKMLLNQRVAEEPYLCDVLSLLLASVIFVPIIQKLSGGSPILGYLASGVFIGPYGLSIIRNVHVTKAVAEFGVVFLLFNIGLELSAERLSSMKKYVFGLGLAQFLATTVALGLFFHYLAGLSGPAAIVIGNGLALSSTAAVLQVLQDRGETTSCHGQATFSVLLFQDLAVVVLLILIPFISPSSSKGGFSFRAIAEALGLAAVKAVIAISAIIVGGRTLLRPIYKKIAENPNKTMFTSNTLLVVLGTSFITAKAGLSMALGAFLAGMLLAETEFALKVESEMAAYRGILLGLFFTTVGMSINPKLLLLNFPFITGTIGLLIAAKTMLVVFAGRLFGLSMISALQAGLLLAPGGEFAFVAFGEAVNQGIISSKLSSLLFVAVGISMAITPWLAAGGQYIASLLELQDV